MEKKKELGYIGLGKMGKNMVFRLQKNNWNVVAYDKDMEKVREVAQRGAFSASSIGEMVSKLSVPRAIWMMVPHAIVDEVLNELMPMLDKGDLVIDGGNSPYQASIKREEELAKKGIEFLDVGVSGGPQGALDGACMMAGGKKESYDKFCGTGFFTDTCVPQGFEYVGKSGAGHFVKMVHNGIEYGMMQSIAEGFDLMKHSSEFDLDLEKIASVYSHESVITSRLVSWMHDGYKKYGKDLNQISGKASHLGEGKWTLEAGKRENISMPAIQTALDVREASQAKPSYQGKIISTLRGEFGQHPVKKEEDEPEVL